MSEQQIPAGWYPDPKDTTSDPRPERWWDGTGWTGTTRPAPEPAAQPSVEDTAVLEGTVLDSGPAVRYPELPPVTDQVPAPAGAVRKPARPVLVAAAVAALIGLAVGSGVTYLAMDGRGDSTASDRRGPRLGGGYGTDGRGGPGSQDGQNGGGQNGGGQNGGGQNGGGQNGQGRGGRPGNTAIDLVNGLSLPVPSGWEAGTTKDGFAALSIGEYTCADGKSSCTLGGAVTGRLKGTDAEQAALEDIAAAAKESYNQVNGHEELKSEAVKVAGRDGYLVRWKVDAAQGNDGYVETVVFPSADGKALVSVHLGFDIADKAPDVAQMDTIVSGIAEAKGGPLGSAGGGTRT